MAILTSKGARAPHQLKGRRNVRISRDRRGSGDEFAKIEEIIGDLTSLKTSEKTNLVSSINEVVDNVNEVARMTFRSIDEIAKRTSWSIDEIVIGTWVDGKPIYRKVFTDPNNSWNAHDNIIGNITDFKEPTSIKAIAFNDKESSGWVENNEAGESHCYAYIRFDGEVHFYRNDILDKNSFPKRVIIEYTKTTD